MEIIGLCGVIGSGKDFKGKEYVKHGYTKAAFADPLRELCYATVGWHPQDDALLYELFKNNYWNPIYKKIQPFTGRDLLERLGKQLMIMFGDDVWVKLWEKKIENLDKVVVTDVRYKEEVQSILQKNGRIYFCNFKSSRYEIRNVESEKLARTLIQKGFVDGDELTQYFKNLLNSGEF